MFEMVRDSSMSTTELQILSFKTHHVSDND